MYLKSLVLKGFKSFADRTVLTLKPGITAVVGPNGSGKSNISDAVLWVLGERNAKNLRGGAMEDVIFAGTPARKPAAVAEVSLVLDNADGTLPVDYSEVVITRRAYRSESGSEYLINGTAARRIDVLNILHDSGLGTGTHSIISQGALDSILQSRPEDRRALIEEAAGVLKHKQRKEKSERKLAAMEQHVERVRDVVAEVGRQLGPLERKAKRALRYQELSAELAEATLQLAVDDLRGLQRTWDELKATGERLAEEQERAIAAVAAAEAAADEVQAQVEAVRVDADEMSRQQQAASAAAERLNSMALLVRDRRQTALSRAEELRVQAVSARQEAEAASAQIGSADAEAAEAARAHEEAKSQVADLSERSAALSAERDRLQSELNGCQAEARAASEAVERARALRDEAREARQAGLAQMQVLDARISELEAQRAAASERKEATEKQAAEAARAFEELRELEAQRREEVGERFQAREAARRALDEARAASHALAGQIEGLEEAQRAAARQAGAAHGWLLSHGDDLPGALEPLAQAVRASAGYEAVVEGLLGPDVAALLIGSAEDAERAASALADADEAGAVTLVLRDDEGRPMAAAPEGSAPGVALLDQLSYGPEAAAAVEALLGDVRVVEGLEEALAAHGACPGRFRFAGRDGSVVWPNGKLTFGAALAGEGEGTLARTRRLDDLQRRSEEGEAALEAAYAASDDADAAWRDAQAASTELAQSVAEGRGRASSAQAEAEHASSALEACEAALAAARSEREGLQGSFDEQQPDAERYEKTIAEDQARVEALQGRIAELASALDAASGSAKTAAEELRAAQSALAAAAERDAYLSAMGDTRRIQLRQARERAAAAEAEEGIKRAAVARLERLGALAATVQASARGAATDADEVVRRAQASTSGLYDQVREAQERRRAAQAAANGCQERVNGLEVERARISMQVEAATRAIVEDCATPLETALALDPLEDRALVEDAAATLTRRIANLGTINPDAAQEYEELKGRFDYLNGQLDDLDGARRALGKIDRIIDGRMRDDFLRTFEEVDASFQRIFAVLFPGGQAHLTLVDPDDLEATGVEVNAQPAGKRIAKMSLMSGGEKSLTALALLFAVYATRATPFYILDEVEAALDDTNLRRLVAYVEQLRDSTQLIMITHQRRTMEMADVLFGLSMQGDGITTVLSQTLNQALRYAE